jgi:hypothetical protein
MRRGETPDLWSRYLAGEPLTSEERLRLEEALRSDRAVQSELLEDAELDGLLQARAKTGSESGLFAQAFLNRLKAEREATGFIKKVETRLGEGDPPKKPGLPDGPRQVEQPATPKRPPTRRANSRTSTPGPHLGPLLIAAGVLFGIVLFFITSSSNSSSPAPANGGSSSAARQKSEREQALSAESKRREAEARLLEIRRKREELARQAAQPGQDPEEQQKRKTEEKRLSGDKERIERELAEAIELAKKLRQPSTEGRPREERPDEPQDPPKEPGLSQETAVMVAIVERVAGEVFIIGKAGKTEAQANRAISAGQGVETGANSLLVLKYPDGTRLECGVETVIREFSHVRGKRLFIQKGAVKSQVAKQPKDQPMVLETPHGEADVLGTTLRLYVDPDPKKGTKLEVEEGKVELKNLAAKTVFVESGHYAVAAVGVELVALPLARLLLPAPWMDQDIGAVGVSGSASYSSGTFTVKGAGADIGMTADSFNYLYQQLTGDGTLIAHVTALGNTSPGAQAGVMIRETLSPSSTFADMLITPRGVSFQGRKQSGTPNFNLGGQSVTVPYWLKIARTGSTFVGSISPDGKSWKDVGTATISMGQTAFIGLAVVSQNTATTTIVVVDLVTR